MFYHSKVARGVVHDRAGAGTALLCIPKSMPDDSEMSLIVSKGFLRLQQTYNTGNTLVRPTNQCRRESPA